MKKTTTKKPFQTKFQPSCRATINSIKEQVNRVQSHKLKWHIRLERVRRDTWLLSWKVSVVACVWAENGLIFISWVCVYTNACRGFVIHNPCWPWKHRFRRGRRDFQRYILHFGRDKNFQCEWLNTHLQEIGKIGSEIVFSSAGADATLCLFSPFPFFPAFHSPQSKAHIHVRFVYVPRWCTKVMQLRIVLLMYAQLVQALLYFFCLCSIIRVECLRPCC